MGGQAIIGAGNGDCGWHFELMRSLEVGAVNNCVTLIHHIPNHMAMFKRRFLNGW